MVKDIDKLDAYAAVLGEKRNKDGIIGEFASAMIGDQFRNLRDGDRFWYEHVMPPDVIKEIKNTTLADLIMRNS